jgi:cytochrome d ubiquinol oxidase subunit II
MTASDLWYALSALFFFAYAALDGFDLGVGTLLLFYRGEEERSTAISAIGPIWNGNEVWLLAAIGSLLAAFPPVYAALLSGLYVPAVLFLLCIIGRDVALEFRARARMPAARRAYEAIFSAASAAAAFLVGFAAGNVTRGLPLDADHYLVKAEATLLNPYAIVAGLLGAGFFALHGAGWLLVKTEGNERERTMRLYAAVLAVFAALAALSFLFSLLQTPALMPWESGRLTVWIFAVLDLLSIAFCVRSFAAKRGRACFAASTAIAAFTVAWLASARFPVLVPSLPEAANSLTTANASAGGTALGSLLVLAIIGVPIVLALNVLLYAVFRGKGARGGEGY